MRFVGGAPTLDFVNTVGGWTGPDRFVDDKIAQYDDLARWSELAGLLTSAETRNLRRRARSRATEAATIVTRAASLRGALYRTLRSVIEKKAHRPSDVDILRRELSMAREHERLTHACGRFEWSWDAAPALDSILWRVSSSAAALLTSPDLTRVRLCAGENCGWLFLDTSRNHSRHWCVMKECGNRAKVRRFRSRLASAKKRRSKPGRP